MNRVNTDSPTLFYLNPQSAGFSRTKIPFFSSYLSGRSFVRRQN